MRRHIVETSPVGPGDEIFGQPVERRVLHSIRSASLESGAHPKRLRKLLAAKGLIPEGHRRHLDNDVVFDADKAQDLLALAGDALSLRDLWTYHNAGRVHARLLTEHGFIKPAIAAGEPGIGWHLFARPDVDAFLARLLADAKPVAVAAGTACDIPLAAKRAHCGGADVVRLILDRRLEWVGQMEGVAGYLSVLVDSDEVRRKVRGPAFDGLSISMVMTELRVTSAVVWALVAAGLLPTSRVVNPANGIRITVVSRADMDKFRAEYVSLVEMAAERGGNLGKVTVALEELGIEPALDPDIYKARFYRRAAVVAWRSKPWP